MSRPPPWVSRAGAGGAVAVVPAQAKGCLKGAVVGGVAGHVAGHHGVVGAVVGCAVGHHLAAKKDREGGRRPRPQTRRSRPARRCADRVFAGFGVLRLRKPATRRCGLAWKRFHANHDVQAPMNPDLHAAPHRRLDAAVVVPVDGVRRRDEWCVPRPVAGANARARAGPAPVPGPAPFPGPHRRPHPVRRQPPFHAAAARYSALADADLRHAGLRPQHPHLRFDDAHRRCRPRSTRRSTRSC